MHDDTDKSDQNPRRGKGKGGKWPAKTGSNDLYQSLSNKLVKVLATPLLHLMIIHEMRV